MFENVISLLRHERDSLKSKLQTINQSPNKHTEKRKELKSQITEYDSAIEILEEAYCSDCGCLLPEHFIACSKYNG
jgi:uncharacterized coiled-coil DUF342 family protein